MAEQLTKERNVLGGQLLACSYDPVTGYFRDGCCATHGEQEVFHLVCVRLSARAPTPTLPRLRQGREQAITE